MAAIDRGAGDGDGTMNAPANIRTPAAVRVDETPAERAHAAVIRAGRAITDEMEMAARCDLAAMRDAASIGIARAGDEAATLLQIVAGIATQAVFSDAPTSKLIRIKSALTLTMMAARDIERLQRDG